MLQCVALICKEGTVVMGVCLRQLCLYMSVVGDIYLFRAGIGHDGPPWECCPRAMHGEWYDVCDFAALLAVEARADHGSANVFHV